MWNVVLLFLGLMKAVSYVAGSGATADEKSGTDLMFKERRAGNTRTDTNQPCTWTQEKLAESLGVTQQAVSVRLRIMGIIQKQGNWVNAREADNGTVLTVRSIRSSCTRC
ncbi:hypothetical protein ALC53_05013 [Atta colombica]|uniref:HTH crp-type domain-containing protein n=1 Tax=Atta colombica TaxID=520822 RepID=A0A151I4J5_9HYME|nr:hypothetical protein ALC53_05013 [Atta colombica]